MEAVEKEDKEMHPTDKDGKNEDEIDGEADEDQAALENNNETVKEEDEQEQTDA